MSKIDKSLVDKFIALAAKGGAESQRVSGSGDLKNIMLRVRGGTVTWYFRYKKAQTSFGYSYPKNTELDISNIKEVANLVIMLRKEFDIAARRGDVEPIKIVDEFIGAYFSFKDELKPGEKPEDINYLDIKRLYESPTIAEIDSPKPTTWTLRQCIEQMLEDRSRSTHSDPLSPASADDYRITMNRSECKDLMDKHACLIDREDIEKVRDILRDTKGLNPARKLVTHVRATLDYCFHEHVGKSGLKGNENWWLMLKFKEKSEPRERTPTLTEIARTMILAEHFSRHKAPKSRIKRMAIGLEVLHAYYFVCLTAQRQGAAVQLECANVHTIDGTVIAEFMNDQMKGKRKFALPLPQSVIDFVPPLHDFGNRKNVFESYLEYPTPVSRSAIYGVLSRLKKYGVLKPNDIEFFTPHDIRRSFAEVLDEAGVPAGASVVLDHVIEHEENLRQKSAKITSKSYHAMQRIPLKTEAMEIWTTALLNEYEKQRREWVPVVPG